MTVPADQLPNRKSWMDAVAVVALVVILLLSARQLRPLAEAGALLARTGDVWHPLPASAWVRAGVWTAVGAAVVLRWRIPALLGAWIATSYEIVIAIQQVNAGVPIDLAAWPLLLALTGALLLTMPVSDPHGWDLLDRRGRWLLGAAAAVFTLSATAGPVLGRYLGPPRPGSFQPVFEIPTRSLDAAVAAAVTLTVVIVLAAASGTDKRIRLRVYALLGAGIAGLAAIESSMPDPFGLSVEVRVFQVVRPGMLMVIAGATLGALLLIIRISERAPSVRL
jgi:hypothetical protein